jgi:hypothetical protein
MCCPLLTSTELHSFTFVTLHIHSVELGSYSMKRTQSFFGIVTLSAVALMGQVQSAQAFDLKLTNGAASPAGVTSQGAYSEYAGLSTVKTVDFNSGSAPTTGFAKYSFQSNNNASNVRADVWAPSGSNGEVNQGNYLAVFSGNDVTIDLESKISYFGINWGAMSSGNTFSFYNGSSLIKAYSTETVAPLASIHAQQHGGEGNGYAHFSASSASEMFDRIVISQTDSSGGFESDNHSFNITDPTKSVPEPGILLGLAAIGGSIWSKRKRG